jgi:hypothetical protein
MTISSPRSRVSSVIPASGTTGCMPCCTLSLPLDTRTSCSLEDTAKKC